MTESQQEQAPNEPAPGQAAAEAQPAADPAPAPAAEAAAPDQAAAGEPREDAAGKAPERRPRSKGGRQVSVGVVYITATFNNTLVSICDPRGGVIAWSSGGRCGFKGSRKSTAYAATMVAQEAARQAGAQGMREVSVRLSGPGAGRESAVRALQTAGLNVTSIEDITPIPHNGCRAPKRRRV